MGGDILVYMQKLNDDRDIVPSIGSIAAGMPALFDLVDDMMILSRVEPDGTMPIVEANESAVRKLGYSRAELRSMQYKSIASLEETDRPIRSAIRDRHLYECQFRTKQGTRLTVEVSSRTFVYNGSKMIMNVARELSDRSRTETIQRLFDRFPDAVFTIDCSGRIESANQEAERLFGYSGEELCRRSIFSFIPILHAGSMWEVLDQVRQKSSLCRDMTLIHRDGRRFELQLTCFPTIVEEQVVGVHIIARDMTEYTKQSRENDKWKALFETASNLIFLGELGEDGDIRITESNQSARKKLGYGKAELASMRLSDLLANRVSTLNRIVKRLEADKRVHLRMSLVSKAGTTVPVDAQITMFEMNGQHMIQTVARELASAGEEAGGGPDRGKKLRIAMANRNVNTSELATRTGLSIATISNLRTGKITKPHIGTAKQIAECLGVDIYELWPEF